MPELHPLLAGRWSPRGFDNGYDVQPGELASLLEAARWAPSRHNGQPWRFVVGRRDDEPFKRIFAQLDAADHRWAWRASALIAAGYQAGGDAATAGAAYDLGQAVAHLGVQALTLGLHTRQIVDFAAERLHDDLALPGDVVLHAVVAVGRLGDPATLPGDLRRREFRLRDRLPVAELVLSSAP